jgi:hypothetical protein
MAPIAFCIHSSSAWFQAGLSAKSLSSVFPRRSFYYEVLSGSACAVPFSVVSLLGTLFVPCDEILFNSVTKD